MKSNFLFIKPTNIYHWGTVTGSPPRDCSHRVLPELQAPAEAVPTRLQSQHSNYDKIGCYIARLAYSLASKRADLTSYFN